MYVKREGERGEEREGEGGEREKKREREGG